MPSFLLVSRFIYVRRSWITTPYEEGDSRHRGEVLSVKRVTLVLSNLGTATAAEIAI